jgi:hypothetical protein
VPRFIFHGFLILCIGVAASSARAQQQDNTATQSERDAGSGDERLERSSAPSGAAEAPATDAPAVDATPPDYGKVGGRIFGVLPNYTTVEGAKAIQPASASQKFQMAVKNSFDPYVPPFIAVVAGVGAGQSGVSYGRRYGMALLDNTVGNFMTTAVMPSALGQDPRYFQLGQGSTWRRIGYAASRIVVTRGTSGASQFNLSEIGGNAFAAGMSNLYYPTGDRTLSANLTRWGMQIVWDSLSNELKEFWPDIRAKLHRD